MLKIGFIGAGTVGTALAVLLNRQGYQVAVVYDVNPLASDKLSQSVKGCRIADCAQSLADKVDFVFITTPDAAIAKVAAEVCWRAGQSVVYCSGADTNAVLEPARLSGADVGGFHPLQTFAGVEQAVGNISGSTFALEAEEPLLSTLKKMAGDLGGSWIKLTAADKAAYHASAVIASNYLVTLLKMSTDLWQTFSVSPDLAVKALLPLVRGTLNNIESIGLPDCLTGPIARGDLGTVKKHLAMLQEKAPELLFPYQELGLQTLPVALAKGKINRRQAREIEAVLQGNAKTSPARVGLPAL